MATSEPTSLCEDEKPVSEVDHKETNNSMDELFDLVSLADLVSESHRTEARQVLKTIDVNIDECGEKTKAESWLQWAKELKYLQVVETEIPDFILPKNCSGKLIDVKVFSKRGPDDHIYDTHKIVRDRVARGNCFIQITRGPHKGPRCILHALKKFTGGLGDDDDNDNGNKLAWKKYFVKPLDSTKVIISTRKANGEAAHLSCIEIDKQLLICAGSKNVHMLIRNRGDIAFYKGGRYKIATEVCNTIMDCLDEMGPEQKQRLLSFLAVTRFTAVFEILSPLHQHVEDLSFLDKPCLQFIAWTSTLLEPASGHQLCVVPPHIGIEIARALGLTTVEYESLQPAQLTEKMTQIRRGFQYEGEVLYFLDEDHCVIGMLKKKTAWYIICRALREKARFCGSTMIKQKSSFSLSKAITLVEKRLKDIQGWLGLSDETISQWEILGIAFLTWAVKQIELHQLGMEDIADKFPIVWKRHLAESGFSDCIVVECPSETLLECISDNNHHEALP